MPCWSLREDKPSRTDWVHRFMNLLPFSVILTRAPTLVLGGSADELVASYSGLRRLKCGRGALTPLPAIAIPAARRGVRAPRLHQDHTVWDKPDRRQPRSSAAQRRIHSGY